MKLSKENETKIIASIVGIVAVFLVDRFIFVPLTTLFRTMNTPLARIIFWFVGFFISVGAFYKQKEK
jgi:hypothetical protein